MDSPETLFQEILAVSQELRDAPIGKLDDVLIRRRTLLDRLADARPTPTDRQALASVVESGQQVRTRLFVDLATIRAEIQERERIRAGLGQFVAKCDASKLVDVRL
jgi:hypothetical protein